MANFMWGYDIAIHLLFVLSTIEFLKWLKDYNPAAAHDKYGISVASVLFGLHLCSGLFISEKFSPAGITFKINHSIHEVQICTRWRNRCLFR
jgi:hypothetical protein